MKKTEIQVGKYYLGKVNTRVVVVLVLEVIQGRVGRQTRRRWRVKNVRSNRETVFYSAAKFRSEASPSQVDDARGIAPNPPGLFRNLIQAAPHRQPAPANITNPPAIELPVASTVDLSSKVFNIVMEAGELYNLVRKLPNGISDDVKVPFASTLEMQATLLRHAQEVVKTWMPAPVEPQAKETIPNFPSEKPIAVGPTYSEEEWASNELAYGKAQEERRQREAEEGDGDSVDLDPDDLDHD